MPVVSPRRDHGAGVQLDEGRLQLPLVVDHATIGQAEAQDVDVVGHAERTQRVDALDGATGDQLATSRRRLLAPRRLAVGDGDETHPMALPAHPPQQRPGPEDLVIGMRSDQDDGIDREALARGDALAQASSPVSRGPFAAGVLVVVALGGLVTRVGVAVTAGVAIVVGLGGLARDVVVVEVAHGASLPTTAVSEPSSPDNLAE